MRKQTKLVAVLSTAALLALGASMSSFAATGWQEENGTWVYYSKNGDLETEKWEKSGDNWFYLNEDGEMATDVVVEFNDNYYYVDENGAMVANKWVSVENEDYDGDDNEQPTNHWYYFGSNGKAYKTSANASGATFKTINGKKYIFDDEGKMLYGWVGTDGERKTSDDAWKEGYYYCGDENDGAQTLGWKLLSIKDEDFKGKDNEPGFTSSNVFDDEDQERWFYFNTNGKKLVEKEDKGINGAKYSFDEYGRMNSEWIIFGATPTDSKVPTGDITATYGSAKYSSSWRYFGSPEDGARKTKGWFKVVPDEMLETGKYNDDEDAWYYSDGDGKLVTSQIKTINGKKYAFDSYGKMKSGFKLIMFADNSSSKFDEILGDDVAGREIDTESDFKANINDWIKDGYKLYYFGSGDDGSMKTGKLNADIDGDSFAFSFNKSGGNKGVAKNGEEDKKFYQGGMLLKADKEDKYSVVKETTKDNKTYYELLTTDKFLSETYVDTNAKVPAGKEDKYSEYAEVKNADAKQNGVKYYLVNTSGAKQTTTKEKAKDGDDRCYKLSSGTIVSVYVEK